MLSEEKFETQMFSKVATSDFSVSRAPRDRRCSKTNSPDERRLCREVRKHLIDEIMKKHRFDKTSKCF